MNTDTNTIYSFWKLISENKIEIPIIQRDYAQGRDDETTADIRERFLGTIMDAFKNNTPLELDFVYGSNENNRIQVLDGQQRLTTLFLLHWLVALRERKLTMRVMETITVADTLRKFTYETRTSSREFCSELSMRHESLGKGNTISEKVKDSAWFIIFWEKDPTIKAMLVMLDAIEEALSHFTGKHLWNKLVDNEALITFHFLELENFGLSDDLYIKMNARGKQLTHFENFKARFEKHIDEQEWEKNISSSQNTFSHKIDTTWADLFWKYRNKQNEIDGSLIRFISGVAINYYAEGRKTNKSESNIIRRLHNNPRAIDTKHFFDESCFMYLKCCFGIYANDNTERLDNLDLWHHCEKPSTIFEEFITEPTYKQRILFYAQTQYYSQAKNPSSESFSNWMRVIRNIVENTRIDEEEPFVSAIGLVSEISTGCENIYKYLSEAKITSQFASEQIAEEQTKSQLIIQTSEWKKQIFKVEDDDFVRGKLLFLLNMSKVYDSYNYEKFMLISNTFLKLFNKRDDLLRLTLLVKEDYKVQTGYSYSLEADRYSLLDKKEDWKEAFRIAGGSNPEKYVEFQSAVELLLNQAVKMNKPREQILNTIIEKHVPKLQDWRRILIKETKLMSYCERKNVCLDDHYLYILKGSRVREDNYKRKRLALHKPRS